MLLNSNLLLSEDNISIVECIKGEMKLIVRYEESLINTYTEWWELLHKTGIVPEDILCGINMYRDILYNRIEDLYHVIELDVASKKNGGIIKFVSGVFEVAEKILCEIEQDYRCMEAFVESKDYQECIVEYLNEINKLVHIILEVNESFDRKLKADCEKFMTI